LYEFGSHFSHHSRLRRAGGLQFDRVNKKPPYSSSGDKNLRRHPSARNLQFLTPFGVLKFMEQLNDVLTAISHPTRRATLKSRLNAQSLLFRAMDSKRG
jgi:hypothetical protein